MLKPRISWANEGLTVEARCNWVFNGFHLRQFVWGKAGQHQKAVLEKKINSHSGDIVRNQLHFIWDI